MAVDLTVLIIRVQHQVTSDLSATIKVQSKVSYFSVVCGFVENNVAYRRGFSLHREGLIFSYHLACAIVHHLENIRRQILEQVIHIHASADQRGHKLQGIHIKAGGINRGCSIC